MSSMAQQAAEVDDQDLWSTTTPADATRGGVGGRRLWLGLQELERELRCLICGHFMHAPVSISPCQHTFCSECIRRHWLRQHVGSGVASQRSCAYCNGPVVITGSQKSSHHSINNNNTNLDACLIPNRTVENMIAHFQKIRMPLFHALTKGPNDNEDDDPSKEEEELEEAEDDCIQDRKKAEPVQRLTRMASTFYKGKNKKQLQELCAQQGLSTQGTEKLLQERHSNFVLLHNSECDSFRPRSKTQLVQIIHQREKERAREQRKSVFDGDYRACMQRIYRERKRLGESKQNVKWNTILSGNIQFDEEMANGFHKLKSELEERERERRKKKIQSGNADDKTTTTASAHNDAEYQKNGETCENEQKNHASQKDDNFSLSSTYTSSKSDTTMEIHQNVAGTCAGNDVVSGTSNELEKIANPSHNNINNKRRSLSVEEKHHSPPKKSKQQTICDSTSSNHFPGSESNASSAPCASLQPAVQHSNLPEMIINPYASNKRSSLSSQGQIHTSTANSIQPSTFNPSSTGDDAKTSASPASSADHGSVRETANPCTDMRRRSLSVHGQLDVPQVHISEPIPPCESFLADRANSGATAEDAIILCD